ncbi:MAG TPA: sensor histidine kinase [Solirubrobacteraceae bacterium]|nr:sensor histidine kinase [Solirubrobacteraceae bacterium]
MTGITCTHRNEVRLEEFPHAQMHQALFYENEREYLDGVMDFIAPGLAAGEPVAAAIPPERGELLARELNDHAGEVEILDMFELGRNPARIIPAVERILAHHDGATLHCVGEPIWPGRTAEEIQEATKHEALINLAWPGSSIRVLCPYDAARLEPDVLEDAERTHPTVIRHGRKYPTAAYRRGRIPSRSDQALPPVPADAAELSFGLEDLSRARALVAQAATHAGLSPTRVSDLVLAESELAGNAVRHGHGRGLLRVWTRPDRVVCQVESRGHIRDPLAGRRLPEPHVAGGLGLWTVNQLCDLVEVRSSEEGTIVRVHALRGG